MPRLAPHWLHKFDDTFLTTDFWLSSSGRNEPGVFSKPFSVVQILIEGPHRTLPGQFVVSSGPIGSFGRLSVGVSMMTSYSDIAAERPLAQIQTKRQKTNSIQSCRHWFYVRRHGVAFCSFCFWFGRIRFQHARTSLFIRFVVCWFSEYSYCLNLLFIDIQHVLWKGLGSGCLGCAKSFRRCHKLTQRLVLVQHIGSL